MREVFLPSPDSVDERALVDDAKDAGVKRIVKLSGSDAEDEANTIGRWHREVVAHVRTNRPDVYVPAD